MMCMLISGPLEEDKTRGKYFFKMGESFSNHLEFKK